MTDPHTELRHAIVTGERKLYLGNAAGSCKLLEGPHGVRTLAAVPDITTITIGTYRYKAFAGNEGVTEFHGNPASLNFKGIPTAKDFVDFCREDLPEMVDVAQAAGKRLCVSINASDAAELVEMIEMIVIAGANEVEINFACPNLEHGEMMCYRASDISAVFLHAGIRGLMHQLRIGAKLGVYSNPADIPRIAKPVTGASFITVTNTFPNGLLFDHNGYPVIKSGKGLGGVSGRAIKAIALGQVFQWREALGPAFRIKGTGGVQTADDVVDMYLAGADEVQVGTAFYFQNANAFTSIMTDFAS